MKIDESYSVSRKWKGRKYLPFIIEQAPAEIDKNEVAPNQERTLFPHFDDEKVIIQLSSNKAGRIFLSKMLLYGSLSYFALMLVQNLASDETSIRTIAIYLTVSLVPAFFGFLLQLKAKSTPDHEHIIFYRLLGLIELPSAKEGESFIIRFNDLKALNTSFTSPIYYSGKIIAFIRDASPYTFSKFIKTLFGRFTYDWIEMSWSNNPMEYWSFYVWYMDRNRPLPPGSAFDAYRQRDYERRKAEGFPPPLYHSVIPTPEWVPEGHTSILDNLN